MKTSLNMRIVVALSAACILTLNASAQDLAPIVNEGAPTLAPILNDSPLAPSPSRVINPAGTDLGVDLLQPIGFRNTNKSACADGSCGCSDGACGCADECADGCCGCAACCPPIVPLVAACPPGSWLHRGFVFGEFLMLRPRNAEVAFGVQVNSATAPPAVPVQIGGVGVVDPTYEPGYRFGFGMVIDCTRSATLSYTNFESRANATLNRVNSLLNPNSVIQGILLHPGTINAQSTGNIAAARLGIDFSFIDADYRELFSYGPNHQYAYLIGARYAQLDQGFNMSVGVNNANFLSSRINFDGVGARFGLEGERYTAGRTLFMYGKSIGSLVAGEFSAFHNQGSNANPSIVNTSWKAGRIVPILETEFGLGVQNGSGSLRLTAGYMFNAWFNTPVIDEWVNAVQTNSYRDIDNGISFDGFTTRLEFRF